MWAEDNDGWCPPSTWFRPDPLLGSFSNYSNPGSLDPYTSASREGTGDVYVCPSAKWETFSTTLRMGDGDATESAAKRQTYGINGWMSACFVGDYRLANYPESPGTKPIVGPEPCPYWGPVGGDRPWGIYLYLHGSTRLQNVRRPSDTVFFTDHEYWCVGPDNFNPFISIESFRKINPLACVATRWHDKRNGLYGYGYGNICSVDGHASKEPSDFTEFPPAGKIARWCYYFWNH